MFRQLFGGGNLCLVPTLEGGGKRLIGTGQFESEVALRPTRKHDGIGKGDGPRPRGPHVQPPTHRIERLKGHPP
jgi:hypothetical protein